MTLTVTTTDRLPWLCKSCAAGEMSCDVKLGLGGRRCCPDCTYLSIKRVDPRDRETT